MAHEWPQGITLQHFSPDEFDRPGLMDPGFLGDLDALRMRCGFPITVNDDARNDEDMRRIYRREIALGKPYPKDSAHLWMEGHPVRAVDLEPAPAREGDGCDLSQEERELRLSYEILRMHDEGRWPHLGFGAESGHWHVDDTPRLGDRRPAWWVLPSR